MNQFVALFLLLGSFPLYRAWRGSFGTTLRHALLWAGLAWVCWMLVYLLDGGESGRYLAVSLGACAGIAVLGARRPGVGAWNFVVIGLLALLCRPFLEGQGELRLDVPHWLFLGVVAGVGVANYLPTRLGGAALLYGSCCLGEMGIVGGSWWGCGLALVPWLAWSSLGRKEETASGRWRRFRDAFGAVWALRVREQFNRAAANAGLEADLSWSEVAPDDERTRNLLEAVTSRFELGSSQ